MATMHVVSVSSGKDSQALLDLAVKRCKPGTVIPIFCDTGNEDQAVYDHLDYLEGLYGLKIVRLKADFSEAIMLKRLFIARDQRLGREKVRIPVFDSQGNPVPARRPGDGQIITKIEKDRDGTERVVVVQKTKKVTGRRVRWSNKAKRGALAVMYPTGNPFLDLCIWKGRFPSRKAQFCTQELKTKMAVEFQMDLLDAGHRVISWQGVRRDESFNRRNAKRIERICPGLWAFRPLVEWTAIQVVRHCVDQGHRLNQLYYEGSDRVGCMPCINCNKGELREIDKRRPWHIDRIASWEKLVGACSKRGHSTFMTDSHTGVDRRKIFEDLNIHARVEWSKTTRGGKQFDLLALMEGAPGCASSYGLCDGPGGAQAIAEVAHQNREAA